MKQQAPPPQQSDESDVACAVPSRAAIAEMINRYFIESFLRVALVLPAQPSNDGAGPVFKQPNRAAAEPAADRSASDSLCRGSPILSPAVGGKRRTPFTEATKARQAGQVGQHCFCCDESAGQAGCSLTVAEFVCAIWQQFISAGSSSAQSGTLIAIIPKQSDAAERMEMIRRFTCSDYFPSSPAARVLLKSSSAIPKAFESCCIAWKIVSFDALCTRLKKSVAQVSARRLGTYVSSRRLGVEHRQSATSVEASTGKWAKRMQSLQM